MRAPAAYQGQNELDIGALSLVKDLFVAIKSGTYLVLSIDRCPGSEQHINHGQNTVAI